MGLGLILYPLLGLSLGLYYNLTFFGAAALPLPEAVSLLAPLLYYLSGCIHLSPAAQASAWISAFLVAGLIWLGCLELVARRAGFRPGLGVVASPTLLLLPAPWMAWLHGLTWSESSTALVVAEQFLQACLVRKFTRTPLQLAGATEHLSTLMLTLGFVAAGVAFWQWYRAASSHLNRALTTWVVAHLLAVLAVVGVSYPLRFVLGQVGAVAVGATGLAGHQAAVLAAPDLDAEGHQFVRGMGRHLHRQPGHRGGGVFMAGSG